MLRRLVALRCLSAREGVELVLDLLGRFGYYAAGRTLVLADPREAWIICMVGGRHWVATRLPDDRALAMANAFPIGRVDFRDRQRWRVSPGLVEYARSRGWYQGTGTDDFDFRRVFSAPRSHTSPANTMRTARARTLLGHPSSPAGGTPFFTSRAGLRPADLMTVLRDHYEGTPRDLTCGYKRGSPNHSGNRTICYGTTCFSLVAQLRSSMPLAIGALLWLCPGRPDTGAYQPWYVGTRLLPSGYSRGRPERGVQTLLAGGGWQPQRAPAMARVLTLQKLVNRNYGPLIKQVRPAMAALEGGWFREQAALEATALAHYRQDPDRCRDLLTGYTLRRSCRVRKLVDSLIGKHPAAAGQEGGGRKRP